MKNWLLKILVFIHLKKRDKWYWSKGFRTYYGYKGAGVDFRRGDRFLGWIITHSTNLEALMKNEDHYCLWRTVDQLNKIKETGVIPKYPINEWTYNGPLKLKRSAT